MPALRQDDDAIACLQKAGVQLGWRDLPALEADENLQALKNDPRVNEIITKVRATPPLPWDR